ncbi:MAG: hypothetical protein JKY10_06930 [Cohaesibacteraceae bacterium]|nr:hypothetical protein [Cohaesibacteraceae bacterium]
MDLDKTRECGWFMPSSFHYSKRPFDGMYEVVGALSTLGAEKMDTDYGRPIVVAVHNNQPDALAAVRHLRNGGQKMTHNTNTPRNNPQPRRQGGRS